MTPSFRAGRTAPVVLLAGFLAAGLGLVLWLTLLGPGSAERDPAGVGRELREAPSAVVRPGPRSALPGAHQDPASSLLPAAVQGSADRQAAVEAPVGPRPLSGRVLARSDGRPVPDAALRLVRGPRQVHGSTDAEGRFALEWSGDSEPVLEVRASGFVPARLPRPAASSTPGAPAEPLIVRLVEGARIEGIVLGPPTSGQGAPSVRLYQRNAGRGASQEVARGAVDARGAFYFADLPAGDYLVAAEAPERVLAVTGATVEPGERAQVLLELSRAGRLSGRVLDDQGRALADVRVRLETQRQGLDWSVQSASRREATTGDDGRFVLIGLAAGGNRVELQAPWGERRQETISLARAGEEVARDFELRPPATLAGRVLDERGAPVPGAQVELAWNRRVPPLIEDRGGPEGLRGGSSVRTRADEHGYFLLRDLPAGQSGVLVAVPAEAGDGRLAVQVGLQLAGGEERSGLELVLGPGLRLTGSVHMQDAGPLAGARVELVPRLPGRGRVEALRTETDLEGRYGFAGLPPGPYRVTARHADAHTLSEVLELADADEELVLELEGALTLSGVVLDEHGLAVPSSGVRAARLEPLEDGRDRRWARSDSYGRFELRELEAGFYELTPFARGYRSLGEPLVVRLPGEGEVWLEMQSELVPPPVTVQGRVQIAGTREPPLGFEVRGARGGFLFYEDGRFRLEGLNAGVHRLALAAEGCVPLALEPLDLGPGARIDLGTLQLEPGTLLRVEVRGPAGERVRGARVGLRPAPGSADGRTGLRVPETGRGRYEAMVPRGDWRLTVGATDLRPETRTLEVLPRALQRVEVTLRAQ